MTFRSTSVTGAGEDYELAGDLTIAGVTKPLTFDVEFHGTEVFPGDQSTHAGFTATGQIKRSDFGIDFGIIAGPRSSCSATRSRSSSTSSSSPPNRTRRSAASGANGP